jgi:hypothetical protein
MPSVDRLRALRTKHYEEATKEEKECWFIYSSKIIPAIVPDWKKRRVLRMYSLVRLLLQLMRTLLFGSYRPPSSLGKKSYGE